MAKSISKNALFKSILNLFNVVLPIMVMPIITLAINPLDLRNATAGETFNGVAIAFASFGVYQYGLREISKVRDDRKKLSQIFTSLFIITTFTTMIVSIIYITCLVIFYKDDPAYYTCLIMSVNIVINLFYVEWVNEALENYDFIAMKTMVVKIIYSIIVICIIRGNNDYWFYIYLGIAINFINNILSYFYIRKSIKFDFSNLEITQYIKPMFIGMLLSNTSLLYTQLDKIIISAYCINRVDLTAFGIAQKAMLIVNTMMLTIIQVTMPRLANKLGNKFESNYLLLLSKIVRIYFLFLFPASIGLFCVSKQVMWILHYTGWFYLMMGFSVYMLTLGVQGIVSNQIIYLNKKEREDVKIVFIGGICNIIISGLLIVTNLFAVTNSIIATTISNIVVIILEYRIVKRQIKLDIHLFSFEYIKYFYYSLLFIPITFLVNYFISSMIISCVLDVSVCGMLYLVILLITRDVMFFEVYEISIVKFKSLFRRIL